MLGLVRKRSRSGKASRRHKIASVSVKADAWRGHMIRKVANVVRVHGSLLDHGTAPARYLGLICRRRNLLFENALL